MTNKYNVTSVVNAHEKERNYITESELQKVLKAASTNRYPTRDKLIVLLLFRHGYRVSELIDIRMNYINLEEGRLWVQRNKNSLSTEHPILGDELRLIKAYLRERKEKLNYFFVNERGTPMTRQAINHILNAIGKKLGMHLHPHMFRHGCGFYLANKGYDLRLIQDYLGHRDPKNTAIYTRTASKRFEGLFT